LILLATPAELPGFALINGLDLQTIRTGVIAPKTLLGAVTNLPRRLFTIRNKTRSRLAPTISAELEDAPEAESSK